MNSIYYVGGRYLVRRAVRRRSGWRVRVRDLETGAVTERVLRTQTAAEAQAIVIAELERRAEPGQGKLFADAWAEFLELLPVLRARPPRAVTLKSYAEIYRAALEPAFATRAIGEITAAEVEDWLLARARAGAGGRTRAKHLALLRRLFRWALRRGYTERDPTEGLELGGAFEPAPPARALSEAEARRLIEAASREVVVPIADRRRRHGHQRVGDRRQLRLAILLGLYTGLRHRNLLELSWRHLDLEARRLELAATEWKGRRPHVVPIHPALARELRAETPEAPGARILRHDFRAAFRSALRAADLPLIRIHDLRHTFCSWLAVRVPWAVLQALMGHAPRDVTALYAHVEWPELLRAIDSLPDLTRRKDAAHGP